MSAGQALSPEHLPLVIALAVLLALPAGASAAFFLRKHAGVNTVDIYGGLGRRQAALATDCALLLSFALSGAALHCSAHSMVAPDDISLLPAGVEIHAEVRVSEARYPEFGRPRAVVAMRRLRIGDAEMRSASGRIWVTLPKGAPVLRRGDLALIMGTPEVPAGSRNPGAFDFSSYLRQRRISRVMRPKSIVFLERPQGVEELSSGIERTIERHLSGEPAALLRGLLLGRTDRLSDDLVQSFRESGTVHVLAVSGLHTGFILLIAFALLRTLRIPPRGARLATIPLLLIFVMVVGGRPSVIRAALMATVFITTWSLERRPSSLNAVGLAALILLLTRPGALFDLGFRLSFAAVLGIIFLRQPILSGMKRVLRCTTRGRSEHSGSRVREFLLGALALSISAQTGVVSIIISSGGSVSLVAPFANLLVVPLAGASVASGLATVALDPLAPWAAHLFAAATWATLKALIVLVRTARDLPAASVALPTSLALPLALAVIALAVGARTRRRKVVISMRGATVALVLGGLATLLTGPGFTSTRVIFFDVGQGDSALVEIPFGHRVLIDAGSAALGWVGPDSGRDVIVPYLKRRGIRSLDAIVITHGHADHYGGVAAVLSSVRVEKLIVTANFVDAGLVPRLLEQAEEVGTRIITLASGDTLHIGPGSAFVCLSPSESGASRAPTENDRSIVLSARLEGLRVLFTGDIEAPTERVLVACGSPVETDILKVAHHGSSTSSTDGFLRASSARMAVISVGEKNRYGHPSAQVVDRLNGMTQELFRTDLDGAVVVDMGREGAIVWCVGSGRREYLDGRGVGSRELRGEVGLHELGGGIETGTHEN